MIYEARHLFNGDCKQQGPMLVMRSQITPKPDNKMDVLVEHIWIGDGNAQSRELAKLADHLCSQQELWFFGAYIKAAFLGHPPPGLDAQLG